MRDDLLHYYERELTFLRQMGAEFAEAYPKVASRLMLEQSKCDDPHVERLLEAFAFLTARVHLKIDDDFSEISEALLHILYPHYIRPIPSMAMVEFVLDPDQGKLTSGLTIQKDSLLYSRPVGGVPCKFRTCYETTLWPVTVSEAAWRTPDSLSPPVKATDAGSALRIRLDCLPDVSFEALGLDTIRLYLNGEGNLVSTLYELLCNNCTRVLIRDPDNPNRAPIEFDPSVLAPVGFAQDEGMLPYPRRAFLGYRLLQEYFAFPAKFSFLDLSVFEAVRNGGFGTSVEIIFLISQFEKADRREMLETGVSAKTLRLGCTPVVNLFSQTSEPVLVNQRAYEYPVVADARRRDTTGIFSVDAVTGVTAGSGAQPRYEPFYSFRHGTNGGGDRSYWYAKRRPAGWRSDAGSIVFLSFVDLSANPVRPHEDSVTAALTCLNGDVPSRLPFGDEQGDWELPGGEPVQKILTLVRPTKVVQPPLGKPQLWRLISQLSLNYLSLVEGGAEAFQELLRLHNFEDFEDSASVEKQIQGIVDIQATPRYSRIDSEHGLSFARGHQVTVEFDEDHFTGGGVYLFASVLDHFFGLYTSINSFSILAAKTRQRRSLLREWAPRAGWKALL